MADKNPQNTEREDIAEQFRAQLEDEHTARQLAQERRRVRSKAEASESKQRRQAILEAEVQDQVRADFHKEKGYKLYTDSAGREHWLTPDEYDWRMRVRAQRDQRRKSFRPSFWARRRTLLLYAGATALAVSIGLFLVE